MTSNVTAHCFSMRAVVLGFSLFLVSVTSAPIAAQDEDPIVAKVGQHAIYRSDVFASIESFPLAEQLNMRKRLDLTVRSLINEELLFQLILSGDSEWDRRLRNEVRGLVVSRVIERYVTEQIEVDDAEIRAYYQEHRDTLRGWHVRARHIRLRHECEDMLAKIDSEETFIEMAKVYSLDNLTAANGGDLGYMMYSEHRRDSLGFESEFFEMALARKSHQRN